MKNIANQLEKIKKESDNPKIKEAIERKKKILSNDKMVKK